MGFNNEKVRFFSIYFTNRLNSFFIIFNSDISNLLIDLSVFLINGKLINFRSHPHFNKLFTFILRLIIVSVAIFEKIDRFRRPYPFLLKLASRSYYRFLKYSYWSVNYKVWNRIKALNYSKAREKVDQLSTMLFRGFKIHCLGRFSRRQRSKSFWIHLGMVPLNNFCVNIDYGNYCIPIKNSLISVKVWINVVQMAEFQDVPENIYY